MSAIAMVVILVSGASGACISDQRYSYWVLNDSDHEVLVDVREQFHRTYLVPPHAYAPLFGGMGVPEDGWTLGLVDEDCVALQTFPVDGASELLMSIRKVSVAWPTTLPGRTVSGPPRQAR